jgi:hypothetical protein
MSDSAAISQSAGMPDLLPTNFVGATMAGVQNEDGRFQVYFQNKEYQIYEMSLDDPKSTDYTLGKLTTSIIPAARINTPIAAVAWKNLQQVRFFNAIPSVFCIISFSLHHDRSACITSLSIVRCRRWSIPKTVVGKKAQP